MPTAVLLLSDVEIVYHPEKRDVFLTVLDNLRPLEGAGILNSVFGHEVSLLR